MAAMVHRAERLRVAVVEEEEPDSLRRVMAALQAVCSARLEVVLQDGRRVL